MMMSKTKKKVLIKWSNYYHTEWLRDRENAIAAAWHFSVLIYSTTWVKSWMENNNSDVCLGLSGEYQSYQHFKLS